MAKHTDLGYTSGSMEMCTMGSGIRGLDRAKEYGKALVVKTRCTSGIGKGARQMDMVHTPGQMETDMMESGSIVSNMAEELISLPMEIST